MFIVALSYVILALALGYAVTVALTMAATFGITAALPAFAAKDHRIRARYKYAQDLIGPMRRRRRILRRPRQRPSLLLDCCPRTRRNSHRHSLDQRLGDAPARPRPSDRHELRRHRRRYRRIPPAPTLTHQTKKEERRTSLPS